MEVVEAIKAQLLALQDQLIAFNPEQLKASQIQVEELKKELQLSEEKAKEEGIKLEKDLKQKHKTEISILTNKMREEINFNMPALEEKIREEVTSKKNEEMKEIRTQYEGQLGGLQIQLKSVTENYEMAKSLAAGPLNTPDESINLPKTQSHDFSISNMTTNENIEMSFDETMGSMSMSMIQNQMIPGKSNSFAGEQDSLQVQMLKGELEQAREALEAREAEIEEIKSGSGQTADVPEDSISMKLLEA